MVPEMVNRLLTGLSLDGAAESLPCVRNCDRIDRSKSTSDIDANTMARSILGSLASTQRMAK